MSDNPLSDARPVNEQFLLKTDLVLDEYYEDVEWLWPGYIPKGFVTAVVAPPGQGKSTFALSLCKILLEGGAWPDGTPCVAIPEDQKLLWLDIEEKLQVFRQRLVDWNVPRGRFIFPINPTRNFVLDHIDDRDWINGVTQRFLPPIIVIDSLTASRTLDGGSLDMREVMAWLGRVAHEHKVTIIVIHHLNKGGAPGKPVSINRCRTVVAQHCASVIALTTPVPEEPELHRLDVIKMNLARIPAALGFTIESDGPHWKSAQPYRSGSVLVQAAMDFLNEMLQTGSMESKDLLQRAASLGFSPSCIHRAKENLSVRSVRNGDLWYSCLPYREEPDRQRHQRDYSHLVPINTPPHNPATSSPAPAPPVAAASVPPTKPEPTEPPMERGLPARTDVPPPHHPATSPPVVPPPDVSMLFQ